MKTERKFLLGLGSAVALVASTAALPADQDFVQKSQVASKDQQTIVREVMNLLMLNPPSDERSEQVSAHSSHASHSSHSSHSSSSR